MSSSDDDGAFGEAMRGVRRLKPPDTVGRRPQRPAPVAKNARAATADLLAESVADRRAGVLAEEIGFRRAQVSERTFRSLRRGEYSIEDEIDLHGLRQRAARQALQAFLAECVARRLGCVRVVHGKGTRSGPGGPVLKASVQQWLSQWDSVLAFTTAQQRHGGTGAVYVLLGDR